MTERDRLSVCEWPMKPSSGRAGESELCNDMNRGFTDDTK